MEPDRAELMLEKAQADLTVAVLFEDRREGTDEQFGFHCQQAIEKAIKSVLGRQGIDYPWTHDLTRLLLLLDANSIPFPPPMREADLYSSFAVRFRYENLPDEGAGVNGSTARPRDRWRR